MTIVIKADRLVDGTGAEPLADPYVVVDGDKIVGVYQGEVPAGIVPAGTETLDYSGCTLLPGLIDAHVHLNLPGDGTSFEETILEDDGVLVASAANAARIALEAGITTVRDTGARRSTTFNLRRALRLGYGKGPRMLLVGQPVTITGGHTWYLGGEADGVDGVRLKVRELCKLGADWIKVMGSGGGTLNTISHKPSYSRAELMAIADEAHRMQRRVTVHTLNAEALDNAIAAGVDGIEHASFLIDDRQNQQFAPEVAERLAQAGIPVTTTLAVGHDCVNTMSAKPTLDPVERVFLDRWEVMNEANLSQFTKLREIGVQFIAGTDAGWRFTKFDSLPDEIWLMTQGGCSAVEAVHAATGKSADVLGIGDLTGRVRVGLAADLLAVAGDPLGDLRGLRDVRLVVQDGVVQVSDGKATRIGAVAGGASA